MNIYKIANKVCVFFETLTNPYTSEIINTKNNGFFAFIWECSNGFKKYIAIMILFSAIVGIIEALIFLLLGDIINQLSSLQSFSYEVWNDFKLYILCFGFLVIGSPLTTMCLTLIKFQTIQGNFPMALRWRFNKTLLKKDVDFFNNEFAGDLSTKVMQTALAVRSVVISLCDTSVFVLIYFLSSAFVLAKFDIILLVPFFTWLIFYLAACFVFIPKLTNVAQKQAKVKSTLTGLLSDIYSNIICVKLFAHSKKELEYTKRGMLQMMPSVYSQQRLVSAFDLIVHTLSMMMTFTVFILSLRETILGEIGPGAIAASTAIALRFSSISQWAMWVIADLFEDVGTVKDGAKVLQVTSLVQDIVHSNSTIKITKGNIKFDNVSFKYEKQTKYVLDNFNMIINHGEKVGLVGVSGAGKSTITKLLVRLYDPQIGNIEIDDQDIKLTNQDLLRSQVSIVSQDTILFHRSIKDNLLIANLNSTDQEIIKAAKLAGAHEFIKQLRDNSNNVGYNANVGERGVKLSGGQKQRIAITRAILKNAPILILDEATSALDSNLEIIIQENLEKIMPGKTVLAIAHRLSTIVNMDRLLVIDKGKIVEEGDHYDLLKKKGYYASLWEKQSRGFI